MSVRNYSKYIKYYPELKKLFESEKAALIFERLEYWSQKYTDGFWKFFEPCAHPQYREGDSWEEEVGFSRKVFKKIFSKFGIHYTSKSEFLKQEDPFQGKLYASYYDRKTNRTYFLRNHDCVTSFFKNLWESTKKVFSKEGRGGGVSGRSCNSPMGRSFPRAYKNNISSKKTLILERESEQKASPPEQPSQDETRPENEKIDFSNAQKMVGIWNTLTQEDEPERPSTLIAVDQALKTSFEGSLEIWENYVRQIASSRFLMQESPKAPDFKAKLLWVIRPETITKIMQGYYSLGDRAIPSSTPAGINPVKQLKEIQQQIQSFQTRTEIDYRKRIEEAKAALSPEETETLRAEFEKTCLEKGRDSRPSVWTSRVKNLYWISFLRETLAKRLGLPAQEQERVAQELQKSGLLAEHKRLEDQLLGKTPTQDRWNAFVTKHRKPDSASHPILSNI